MRSVLAFSDAKLRRLWIAQGCGAVGDEMFRVAMVWIAVGAIGSLAAWLPALQSTVLILATTIAGRVAGADARAMTGASLIRAAAVLAPAVWAAVGGQPVIALVGAVMILSATRAVFDPALQTSLGRLAADDDLLRSANGLFDATARFARFIGPMLAAALVLVMPVIDLLVVNAGLALAGAAVVWSLRRALPPFELPARHASIANGLRIVAAHRLLRVLMATGLFNNMSWVVTITIGLALLIDERAPSAFGLPGASAFGMVFAAYGFGNISGNIVAVSLRQTPGVAVMFGSVVLLHGCLALMGIAGLWASQATLLYWLMAAAAVGAFGPAFYDIPYQMIIQRQATQHVAAVFRAKMLSQNVGVLVGLIAAPAFFDRMGPSWVIIVLGVASVAVTAIGWVFAARAVRADASAR